LPAGWRVVDNLEGQSVWGKGVTSGNDPDRYSVDDLQTGSCSGSGAGMAVSSVHLMLVNLSIKDTPVGYNPPIGPPVHFTIRYNHRDYLLPPTPGPLSPLGPGWTHDWNEAVRENPGNPLGDLRYTPGGGGAHTYSSPGSAGGGGSSSAVMQRARLTRPGTNTYELVYPDGSKKVFGQRFGASGTLLLTRLEDSAGNAVVLTYDGFFRLAALTDAIGQVTTLSYENTNSPYLLTKVTDPFGRFATIDYAMLDFPLDQPNPSCTNYINYGSTGFLDKITDVLGLQSQFAYASVDSVPTNHSCDPSDGMIVLYNGIVESMTTPYGTTSFSMSGGPPTTNNSRVAQITYPDGSRERVEYNQSQALGIPARDPTSSLPVGVGTFNENLFARNTYYWSRTACASSYGDYTKARIYHWLHTLSPTVTSGVLESVKEPLEGRVWYNYPDQTSQGGVAWIGSSDRPTKIGRVLDDGQTQLYTMAYNESGRLTNSIDPLGRTLSYLYASNGIDLLEIRQTRGGNNELLVRTTYNEQHRPLTTVGADGQTNIATYNTRGQILTQTNPKGDTTTYSYDAEGKLFAINGPLPGSGDTTKFNYDALGRVRAITDVSGYRIALEYDDLDRVTRMTYPDSTFEQFIYQLLDLASIRDRAGRHGFFEYDNMRQMKQKTDPLGRVTLMDWCRCGSLRSLTDPLGRTTSWFTDVQGRPTGKQYADGNQITYVYEKTSSRLRHVIDEKQQVTELAWNVDDTAKSMAYFNTTVPTPGVSYSYDTNYPRVLSMRDGTGTTLYSYNPITGTPTLGAGALASVDGPLPDDTITYAYDELGRPIHHAINGTVVASTFDAAGRLTGVTNALGSFAYAYDGSSARLLSASFPNGQTGAFSYGNTNQDLLLQRITHKLGLMPISEFLYSHDIPERRIATWSQQVEAASPSLHTFGYDAVNQLLSATITSSGTLINTFAYTYDPLGNRLTERDGASNHVATFNGLNQLSTSTAPGFTRTNEWDAQDRLVAVNVGNQRAEYTYDGMGRRVAIRHLVNGSEVSHRRFVWCGDQICEERNAAGQVVKRFFPQGMKVESGPSAGAFFYTRDHLGSVRELTDGGGNVRARYAYDPWGRRTKLMGDMEADFGFADMFWSAEVNLSLAQFRAYDPELGRWLSRDPLPKAEMLQGPNLYAYVHNMPTSRIDPQGLADSAKIAALKICASYPAMCLEILKITAGVGAAGAAAKTLQGMGAVGPATANAIQCAGPEIPALVETALPAVEAELPAAENAALQIIRGPGMERVFNSIETSGGGRVLARGITSFADTIVSPRTAYINQRYEQAEEWIDAILTATRDYRYMLSEEETPEAFGLIVQMGRWLFGITGPFTPY
jgi:RHS repeat-associated protein